MMRRLPQPFPPRLRMLRKHSRSAPSNKHRAKANNLRASMVVEGPRSLPEQTQSQPLPADSRRGYESEEENQRAKKRKLTRTMSEKREMSAGLYSTPDSSPTSMGSPDSLSNDAAPVMKPHPALPRLKSPPITQSTPVKAAVVKERPRALPPFSAKTSRALDNLSVRDKPAGQKQQIPLRFGRSDPPQPEALPMERPSPPAITPRPQGMAAAVSRKKRLIDVLAEQAQESSSGDEDADSQEDEVMMLGQRAPVPTRSTTPPPALQPQPQSAVCPCISYGQETRAEIHIWSAENNPRRTKFYA